MVQELGLDFFDFSAVRFFRGEVKVITVQTSSDNLSTYKLIGEYGIYQAISLKDIQNNSYAIRMLHILNDPSLREHVFRAAFAKKSKNVVGGHLASGFDEVNLRLVNGPTDLSLYPTNRHGVIFIHESVGVEKKRILKDHQGHVIGERWMSKNISQEGHTVFPLDWDDEQIIIEEFATALINPKRSFYMKSANGFIAKSRSGVIFGWWVDYNNNITSFFPIH